MFISTCFRYFVFESGLLVLRLGAAGGRSGGLISRNGWCLMPLVLWGWVVIFYDWFTCYLGRVRLPPSMSIGSFWLRRGPARLKSLNSCWELICFLFAGHLDFWFLKIVGEWEFWIGGLRLLRTGDWEFGMLDLVGIFRLNLESFLLLSGVNPPLDMGLLFSKASSSSDWLCWFNIFNSYFILLRWSWFLSSNSPVWVPFSSIKSIVCKVWVSFSTTNDDD